MSRVTNDVDMISQSLNMSIGTLVSAVATLVGCVVMMFITEWHMALTAIGASLIGFIGMGLIMGKSQKYFNARQQSLAEVNSHVEEYYAGQTIHYLSLSWQICKICKNHCKSLDISVIKC